MIFYPKKNEKKNRNRIIFKDTLDKPKKHVNINTDKDIKRFIPICLFEKHL